MDGSFPHTQSSALTKNALAAVEGKNASLFIRFSGLAVGMAALTVLWGWYTHNAFLLQINPDYLAMKFNTVLSFLFVSAALLAAERDYRLTATFLAVLGATLPALTFFEYVFGPDLGIDNLVMTPFFDDHVAYPGRMALISAVVFVLVSAAIGVYAQFQPLRNFGEVVLAFAGSLTVAAGSLSLITYLTGNASALNWGDITGMALHTSVCFILLGSSIIACAWKKSSRYPSWLGVPVALSFLIIALATWLEVTSYEDIHFDQSLQTEATYLAGRSTDRFTAFYAAMDRLANRWVVAGGTPRTVWESDAQNYIKGYTFLRALEWVDHDNHMQWAINTTQDPNAFDVKPISEALRDEVYKQATSTNTPLVTKLVNFVQGGNGFLYVAPLTIKGQSDGLMVAAFVTDEFFGKILSRETYGPFYLIVYENNRVVYSNAPAGFIPSERWKKTGIIKNRDSEWVLTVNPAPEMLAKKNSPLPNFVLITGLLTSIFGTFAVLLALQSRRDTETLKASEDRLREIIDTHSLLGSAEFDLQAFMTNVVHRILPLTNATGAVIELVEDEMMVYRAVSGSLVNFINMQLKRAGSLSGMCVEKSAIMISEDTSNDARVDAAACQKVGARSMVVAPLVQRGMVAGVIKIVSTRPYAFTKETIQSLQLMGGLLGGALGQQMEIERRQKLEEQLRHLAHNDSLTELPNRMLFRDRLTQAILNNARNKNFLAVMYMDIDHFKTINDKYGHAQGDALLRMFGVRTTKAIRKGDTLARLGGDEFTLILENLKDPKDAEIIAAKIVEATRPPFDLPSGLLDVTVSIGIAISSTADTDPDKLVEKADKALYEAKRAGRNCYKIAGI